MFLRYSHSHIPRASHIHVLTVSKWILVLQVHTSIQILKIHDKAKRLCKYSIARIRYESTQNAIVLFQKWSWPFPTMKLAKKAHQDVGAKYYFIYLVHIGA